MRIQCPSCFIEVEAPGARVGDHGQCASCGVGFVVPQAATNRIELLEAGDLPISEIVCPVCATCVKVNPENLGKKGRCERCHSKFIVPETPDGVVEIIERGRVPISKLNCPVCSTVVRVSWVNLGKKGRCENCHSKFIVPEKKGEEIKIIERGTDHSHSVDERVPREIGGSFAE